MDNFISHLASENISLSIENQKALCTTLYSRVLALQKYDALSLPRIRAPITLLKPTHSSTYMVEEDYGLRKVMFPLYVFLNAIFKIIYIFSNF